ncbi:DUF488 domain-containing protein [Niabella insulamsoli]|uniref:DUF488 domain-containing protein n=1 Tax=Niabella insulamsoli TaxID=3144874 RepID=UPI0031FC0EE7
MSRSKQHIVYTIGHSTNTIEKFIEMLRSFDIKLLADVRGLPGSNKFPQFNQENLERSLPEHKIHYQYFKDLGGRRRALKNSLNTRWLNASFRGYADYMETDNFEKAMLQLKKQAAKKATAIMCAEALWWRCHRSMIADYLTAQGWQVLHIMNIGKVQEHRYTSPATVVGDKVSYHD